MDSGLQFLIDLAVILILFAGIWQFHTTRGAKWGNLTGAFALASAVALVLYRHPVLEPGLVVAAIVVGGIIGVAIALRANMIQIPAIVAFQHGFGGVAVSFVSYVELARVTETLPLAGRISGLLGLVLGAATFSGSLIASAKLANRIKQTPVVLPNHNLVLGSLALVALVLVVISGISGILPVHAALIVLSAVSVVLGVVFAIRIGGADMPVLISFLNATAGFAAALCGIVIQNRLLIACGATVAASGSILTHIMCKGMNRSLRNVFISASTKAEAVKGAAAPASAPAVASKSTETPASAPATAAVAPAPAKPVGDLYAEAAEAAKAAKTVVIIPGYGMALAHAQFEVVDLANRLQKRGADVKFAVHPVAGRMPGHMHVILAEAEVDPDVLFEMNQVNDQLKNTDVVFVVGASDVVNPSAISVKGTPISGMPILLAHEAKRVIVCNLDDKPGYSGVENSLYKDPKALLLLGDAKATIAELIQRLA
ncbi:MAG: NAD(P)(+) transhydrogenase (Re/Si-specific) subunit beta [Gemmatimonadetes bacterium]|nr:NAD(P)(+) transhydrogenase (Re/Si-specific) subunit beta [Gemmatimonadota bacterium]